MSKRLHDMQRVTLDGLSLAEWEYAYRYKDYLELGNEKPQPAGFDPARIAEIERILNEYFGGILKTIRGSRAR
jgi:hypothetical protein